MFKNFAAAWGVIGGAFHYNKNGEVVYGSIQPEYKEFIKEMNKWYKEGLIDPEFPSINKNIVDSNMTSGISGATIGLLGSQLGNYIKAGDPATGYKLAGAEYPSLDENSPHYCGFTNMTKMVPYGDGTAVTAKSKNKEVAIKLLDYMYSGAAFGTLNYGIEGKSYTILENGERRFTDDILNNKEGKSPSQAIIPYALTIYGVGPKVMSSDAYNQAMNNFPEQKDASQKWGESDLSLLPVAAPLTTDENTKVTKMMADIKTYESEMFVKMVVGIEPIESFDKFVQKIKEFGIDEVVEIYKNAYKRAEAK